MKRRIFAVLCAVTVCSKYSEAGIFGRSKDKTPAPASQLDEYVRAAGAGAAREAEEALPGALWSPSARLNDMGRDLRASMVDDVVTIQVSESVNAAATGATSSQRASAASANITSLAGKTSAAGALSNLAGLSGSQKLDGAGTTSRTTTLSATLTARVVQVLSGGLLLVEGSKSIQVNSEQQLVTVRGVVRPADISTNNVISSVQIADLEVRLNGKGVVGDAIRRPNILYRLLLGVLPF